MYIMHRWVDVNFHPWPVRTTYMIVRLDQKTKNAKCEIYLNFKQMMAPVVCGFNPCHISTFVLHKKQESIKTCYPSPPHNNKTTPKTSESLKTCRTEKATKTLEKLKYGYCKFVSLVGKIMWLTNMINKPRTLVN